MKKKPWFRASDGWWYGQVGTGRRRRQQRLVEGEANGRKAAKLYRKLLEEGSGDLSGHSKAVTVFKLFLARHSKKKCVPETHAWYRHYLRSFCRKYGRVRVGDLKPLDAEEWLDGTDWSDTTRNRAVTCLKVALNWAVRMGVLKENPLRNLTKPPMGRRDRIVSAAERRALLSGCGDKPFKLFVFALISTGARPSEVRKVTAKEFVMPGLWVFPPKQHKTGKKTNRPRVVYLTPPMAKLCERLAARQQPGQPLFLNSRGRPWTNNAVRCRFRAIRDRNAAERAAVEDEKERAKIPDLAGVTAYAMRHTFTTEGLVAGVPVAQMQELLGHTSPAMLAHYAHLGQQAAAMRQAAARATRPQPPEGKRPA